MEFMYQQKGVFWMASTDGKINKKDWLVFADVNLFKLTLKHIKAKHKLKSGKTFYYKS